MSRPSSTDELPDRILFRPLAAFLVRGLVHTPLGANGITALAACAGVLAGVALAFRQGALFAAATGAMLVLDCADGQMARRKGGGGVWGRVVDGVGDYVTAIAVHVGLLIWLAHDHGWATSLGWGIPAGLSMAWTSYLFDTYKRRYRGDVDDVEEVRRARDEARGLKRYLIGSFLPYAERIGTRAAPADPDRYRARARAAMALWLWVGPTTHFVAWAVLAAMGEPLTYAKAAVVPFNLLALAALVLQWQAEREAGDR